MWNGTTHFTTIGLLLQYFPAVTAQTHYQITRKMWGKICQLRCNLTRASSLMLETDQEHSHSQTIASRLAQNNASATSRQRIGEMYFCWQGHAVSPSLSPSSSRENQGTCSPQAPLTTTWNLRSQQRRQAPGTNVEMKLRSNWAIMLKDSQWDDRLQKKHWGSLSLW